MAVVLLGVAGQGEAAAEEGEVPHVDEGDRCARVQAENSDTGERSDYLGEQKTFEFVHYYFYT